MDSPCDHVARPTGDGSGRRRPGFFIAASAVEGNPDRGAPGVLDVAAQRQLAAQSSDSIFRQLRRFTWRAVIARSEATKQSILPLRGLAPSRLYRNRQLSIQTLGASQFLPTNVCSSLLIRASIASVQSCSATRLARAKWSLARTVRRCRQYKRAKPNSTRALNIPRSLN